MMAAGPALAEVEVSADTPGVDWPFKADTGLLHCGKWENSYHAVILIDKRYYPLTKTAHMTRWENGFGEITDVVDGPRTRSGPKQTSDEIFARLVPLAEMANAFCEN